MGIPVSCHWLRWPGHQARTARGTSSSQERAPGLPPRGASPSGTATPRPLVPVAERSACRRAGTAQPPGAVAACAPSAGHGELGWADDPRHRFLMDAGRRVNGDEQATADPVRIRKVGRLTAHMAPDEARGQDRVTVPGSRPWVICLSPPRRSQARRRRCAAPPRPCAHRRRRVDHARRFGPQRLPGGCGPTAGPGA